MADHSDSWAKLEQAIEANETFSGPTKRRIIYKTSKAPPPLGPYNQAVQVDDTLYISGQIGLILGTKILPENIEEQATLVFSYIKEILSAAGAGFGNVVRVTVYMQDMADFSAVNDVFKTYFPADVAPARVAYQVGKLPLGALVEVDAIAVVGNLLTQTVEV